MRLCNFGNFSDIFGGIIEILLPVEVGREIVVGGNRQGILQQGLAVAYVRLTVLFLFELPVAPAHLGPVGLG